MTLATRAAILDAADALFGEVGFEAASTRRVAELGGVNKALIHYHFKDKTALWSSVLDRYYARLDAALAAALARPGTPRERLVALGAAYLDFLVENRSFARMVQREIAGDRQLGRIVERMAPLFARGVTFIEQTYPAARAGPLSAMQLLVSFYAMAASWVLVAPVVEGLTGADPLDARGLSARKAHLEQMADLVIDALEGAAPRVVPRRTGKKRQP